MVPQAPSPTQEARADRGGSGPARDPVQRPQPLVYLSILGLFFLLSMAVLVVSWPGYANARHTRKAEAALEEGQWEKAIPHLLAITSRFPGAWIRQRQLGDALLALGRPREALDAYKAALRYQPDLDLRAELGGVFYLIDPADSQGPNLLEQALSDHPDQAEAHFYVAMYLKDQGRYREAGLHFLGATADPVWFERSRPHIAEIRQRLLNDQG